MNKHYADGGDLSIFTSDTQVLIVCAGGPHYWVIDAQKHEVHIPMGGPVTQSVPGGGAGGGYSGGGAATAIAVPSGTLDALVKEFGSDVATVFDRFDTST